jgi:peptidoglycan hydrolase-like protein with peptidoglycan-binding domain
MVPSPNLTTDGVLGRKSIQAIQAFQESYNLTPDGKVGTLTRATLESAQTGTTPTPQTLSCTSGATFDPLTGLPCTTTSTLNISRTLKLTTPRMTGNDIKELQTYLNTNGYNTGTPDGVYGTGTSQAIVLFQKSNNLTADGSVGPKTLSYISKLSPTTTTPTTDTTTITKISGGGGGGSTKPKVIPDTVAPTVSITSPTNNTTVSGTITINATATDNVGVSKVDFYKDSDTTPFDSKISSYTTSLNTATLTNGTHTFKAIAYDTKGNTSTPSTITTTISNTVVTLLPAVNPSNTVQGLDYKYYEATSYTVLPNFPTLTPVKMGTTTNFDITLANRLEAFSFNFTGYVSVPTDGEYTFYTSSDDGSRIYIDDILVVNNDGLHGSIEASGIIGLKAGKHAISTQYFNQLGGKTLVVRYDGPGIAKQNIPTTSLSRVNIPDTTKPIVSSFTIPTTSSTLSIETAFVATDAVGVTGYAITESSSTPSTFLSTMPTVYTFTSAGSKTLYAWAHDAAGNISTPVPATTTVTLIVADTTKPIITTFSISTDSSTLSIPISTFTVTDNVAVTGYILTESSTIPTISSLSVSKPTTYTFTSAGSKTLYAWARDAAGNISLSSSDTITVTLVVTPPTTLNTYYISPSGNDTSGTGTTTNPWKSLYKACSSVTTSGSTVHVKAGTYIETLPCNLSVGVSIEGEGQNNTIINSTYSFSVLPYGNFGKGSIALISSSENTNGNQTISDLTLDGGWTPTSTNTTTATRGIIVRSRGNVTLNRISVKNFWVNGIGFYANGSVFAQPTKRSDGNILMYSTVRNNGNGYWSTGGAYEGGAGVEIYGQSNLLVHDNTISNIDRPDRNSDLMARFDFSVGVKIYNNEFWKTEMEGPNNLWNFGLETWNIQGGVEIYDNDFHGGYIPIDLGGPINTKGTYDYSVKVYRNNIVRATAVDASEGAASAIHLESTQEISDVYIYDNYIENFAQALHMSDGAPGEVTSHKRRIYFYNNLAVNNQWAQSWTMNIIGISNRSGTGSTVSDIHIENNTFTGKAGKSQYGIDIFGVGTISNIFIKNNIFYQLNNANSQGFVHMPNTKDSSTSGLRSNINIENNLTYLTGNNNNVSYSGTINSYTNANNLKVDPLFISSTDFHLQPSSPAINIGTNVGLPYNGSAPDIGVYEYGVLGATTYHFTLNLKQGSIGNEVKELQKILISKGYLKILNPTETFGPLTEKALKEYQKDNNLDSDGIVGEKTRGVLNK